MNVFFVFKRRVKLGRQLEELRTCSLAAACGSCEILRPVAATSPCCHRRGDGKKLELATPPLDGTILPGITRQSVLDLARSWRVRPLRRPQTKRTALGLIISACGCRRAG